MSTCGRVIVRQLQVCYYQYRWTIISFPYFFRLSRHFLMLGLKRLFPRRYLSQFSLFTEHYDSTDFETTCVATTRRYRVNKNEALYYACNRGRIASRGSHEVNNPIQAYLE